MNTEMKRCAAALACAAAVAVGAWAQKVSTTFDEKYDFAGHKNYKWRENRLMTQQNPDTNAVMDRKIVKNANEALKSKGFVEVPENPDFYLYYDGGGNLDIGAGGANQVAGGPKTSADVSPGFGLGQGPALAPSTWLKVNGVIVFHMVDAQSKRAVWETTYRKTFRDRDKALKNMDKEVGELVTKSFKDFPPKAKK